MNVTVEAVYEDGVFRPLSPVPEIEEHQRVTLIVESTNIIAGQRRQRIQLDPEIATEIGDSPEYSIFES